MSLEPTPETTTPPLDARSIDELNLVVRARKAVRNLNISTIGALVQHTAADLLECKNFGATSLANVRENLAAIGLKLKGD